MAAIKRNFALSSGLGFSADTLYSISLVDSTTKSTGSIISQGGAGIAKSLSLGGNLQLFNGSYYTSFKSSATGNTVYILPATTPAIGASVLQSDSIGNLSWVPMVANSAQSGFIGLGNTTVGLGTTLGIVGTGISITYEGNNLKLRSAIAITSSYPSGAIQGDLLWHDTEGTLKIYYDDGQNEGQWVDASLRWGSGQYVTFPSLGTGTQYQMAYFASSGQTVTGDASFENNTTIGRVAISHGTGSTSTSTGALVVTGGVGIGGSIFGGSTFSSADNIIVNSAKEIRFNNSTNTKYTGFKSGSSSNNTTYTLPIDFPSIGSSVLQSDTSGILTWVPQSMVTGGIAGTLVNGSLSDVAYKKTFLLDGTNDTIQMQLPSGIVEGSQISVSLWAKWKSVGTTTATIQTLVDNQYQVAGNIGFFLQDRPDLSSVLEWSTQPNNAVNRRVYSTQVVGDGTWHHIVGTNDGTYSRLYVDGYETGTAKTSAGIAITQDMLCIGNWAYVYSSPRYMNGHVSNFKVYNRALSATEILSDYYSTKTRFFPNENTVKNGLIVNYDYSLPTSYVGSGNTINDLSGSGITATLVNGPSYARTSGGSISFDGVDDYLITNTVNLSSFNSITLTFWAKILNYRESVGVSNNIVELSSNYNNTTGGFNISFGDDSSAGFGSVYPITLAVKGNSGYNFSTYSKTLVNDLGWHYWACVLDKSQSSSEVALYVDGALKTPLITSISNNTNSFDNASLYLSNRAPGNFSISNLQLYNRVLTATEVTQNFNALRERYNI